MRTWDVSCTWPLRDSTYLRLGSANTLLIWVLRAKTSKSHKSDTLCKATRLAYLVMRPMHWKDRKGKMIFKCHVILMVNCSLLMKTWLECAFSVFTAWTSVAARAQTAVFSPDQSNQTEGVNTSVHIHYCRSSQSKHVLRVCYLVSTDDHQSAAAVLCPAGQELSLLLWEGL